MVILDKIIYIFIIAPVYLAVILSDTYRVVSKILLAILIAGMTYLVMIKLNSVVLIRLLILLFLATIKSVYVLDKYKRRCK